jgi:transposase InsO family protein
VAIGWFGKPKIFNIDQGLQFISIDFTKVLLAEDIKISMDGRGAWRDNVFVERLWKSVKYEEVYLRAYETVSHARASIGRYLEFYNGRRPHSNLGPKTGPRLLQSIASRSGLNPAANPLTRMCPHETGSVRERDLIHTNVH